MAARQNHPTMPNPHLAALIYAYWSGQHLGQQVYSLTFPANGLSIAEKNLCILEMYDFIFRGITDPVNHTLKPIRYMLCQQDILRPRNWDAVAHDFEAPDINIGFLYAMLAVRRLSLNGTRNDLIWRLRALFTGQWPIFLDAYGLTRAQQPISRHLEVSEDQRQGWNQVTASDQLQRSTPNRFYPTRAHDLQPTPSQDTTRPQTRALLPVEPHHSFFQGLSAQNQRSHPYSTRQPLPGATPWFIPGRRDLPPTAQNQNRLMAALTPRILSHIPNLGTNEVTVNRVPNVTTPPVLARGRLPRFVSSNPLPQPPPDTTVRAPAPPMPRAPPPTPEPVPALPTAPIEPPPPRPQVQPGAAPMRPTTLTTTAHVIVDSPGFLQRMRRVYPSPYEEDEAPRPDPLQPQAPLPAQPERQLTPEGSVEYIDDPNAPTTGLGSDNDSDEDHTQCCGNDTTSNDEDEPGQIVPRSRSTTPPNVANEDPTS